MTDVPIRIKISSGEAESGKQRVVRSLQEIRSSAANTNTELDKIGPRTKKSTDAATSSINIMRRALVALGGVYLAKNVLQMADSFTNLQNRLKLVTNGVEELNTVTKELFRISNETRSSFETTAEVYARTALATKELGLSQKETLEFTKSLNQAVILSGASTAEASAGMIQLSQGLASGTLRGDELRSVLEQLPAVADVISKSMGVTRGELRKLGQEGKITAEDIINAFKKSSDELDANFGKTVPTIGQSLTVLRNNFLEMVGAFNNATGITTGISQAILVLANNMQLIGKVIGELAITLGVTFGVIAINKAIVGLRALYTVMLANPFFALIAGVTAVVQAFGGWRVSALYVEAAMLTLATGFISAGATIGNVATAIWEGIKSAFGAAGDIVAGFITDLQEFVANPLDNGGFNNLGAALEKGIVGSFSEAFKKTRLEGKQFQEDLSNGLQDKLLQIGNQIDAIKNEKFTIEGNADLNTKGINTSTTAANEEAMKKLLERRKQLLEEIKGPEEDYKNAQEDLNYFLENNIITLREFNEELANQELAFLRSKDATDFAEGYANQLRIMELETRNATADMGKQFAEVFGPGGELHKGTASAIAGSIVYGRSWEESIQNVVKSITEKLLTSLIEVGLQLIFNTRQQMAFNAAASAGGGGGGLFGSLLGAVGGAFSGGFGAQGGLSRLIGTGSANFIGPMQSWGGLGFASGGYTGNGGINDPAGIVHGKEFVVNANATSKYRSALEAMNKGEPLKAGNAEGGFKLSIINNAPGVEFETRQISEKEVEVIASRVVKREAPQVISSDINNPNGKTSKAINNNLSAQRRRS